jgi:hypothetical protein
VCQAWHDPLAHESELVLASGGLKSGTDALDDQLALHLCQARHDVQKKRPAGVFVSMPFIYRGSLEVLG